MHAPTHTGLASAQPPEIDSHRQRACHMATNMINCAYNYCPMATNMVQYLCQLPYGNERDLNDGKRTSRTPQRAWLEPVQAKAQRQGILLCHKVENGRNLHHVTNQIAGTDERTSTGEDRGCVRVADIFSVASQLETGHRLVPEGTVTNCYLMLPCVHYSALRNKSQQCAMVGYEVAVREDYHYE